MTAFPASKRRYLTQAEAERCEKAKEPVCKCRCGGEKHGAGRVSNGDFSQLPMDDPHYRPPITHKRAQQILYHAGLYMRFPRFVERDSYIAEHGFEAWEEINKLERQAYLDAQGILVSAREQIAGKNCCDPPPR